MYRVAIIENEKEFIDLMIEYLNRYSKEEGLDISIKTFYDAPSFLFDFHKQYDIIFSDIDMPKINGYDASKKIREIDENVVLVFVTQLTQYAIKGYEVNASDYILKPIEYNSLKLKMSRLIKHIHKNNDETLVITASSNEKYTIKLNELIYVESDDHLLKYVLNDDEHYCFGSLSKLESKLPSDFFRCHASYLVNLSYVSKIDNKSIYLKNGSMIPLARAKRKSFLQEIQKFYINGN